MERAFSHDPSKDQPKKEDGKATAAAVLPERLSRSAPSSPVLPQKDFPAAVMKPKKRHFGSVTDLTPQAILSEDESSSDEEETVKKQQPAPPILSALFASTEVGSGSAETDPRIAEEEHAKREAEKRAIDERNLVQSILEELGTR